MQRPIAQDSDLAMQSGYSVDTESESSPEKTSSESEGDTQILPQSRRGGKMLDTLGTISMSISEGASIDDIMSIATSGDYQFSEGKQKL